MSLVPFENVGTTKKGAVKLTAPEFRTMNDELKNGDSPAAVLEKLEKARSGIGR